VPDAILLKSGSLTTDEWNIIRSHQKIGEELVAAAFASQPLCDILRSCHLRFEGDPKRDVRKGSDIPIGARFLAIADAYDSMVTDQVYRKRRSMQEAFEELSANAGTQFDPELVEVFIRRIGDREPCGQDALTTTCLAGSMAG